MPTVFTLQRSENSIFAWKIHQWSLLGKLWPQGVPGHECCAQFKPRGQPLARSRAGLPPPASRGGVYKEAVHCQHLFPFQVPLALLREHLASWLAQGMGTEAAHFVVSAQSLINWVTLNPFLSSGAHFLPWRGIYKSVSRKSFWWVAPTRFLKKRNRLVGINRDVQKRVGFESSSYKCSSLQCKCDFNSLLEI